MQAVIAALAASAVSFAVLYLLLARRIRKLVDPQAVVAQIRREIEELIVELDHTTERNISLMEDKIASLSGVLEKAEKRISILRREAAALAQSERAYASLRGAPAAAGPDETLAEAGVQARAARVEGVSSRRRLKPARGRTRQPAEPQAGVDQGSRLEPEARLEPEVRERILSLHRAGISPDSICRTVRVPRATVELIVALAEEAT